MKIDLISNRPASLINSAGERNSATLLEISHLGASVLAELEAEIGALLKLRFSLPIAHKFSEFLCNVEITHCKTTPQGSHLKMNFFNLSEKAETKLQHFASDKVTTLMANFD